jgi:hypothetical protein
MRTYTGHYRGHTVVPKHLIDDSTALDPDPAERVYFELDDGTILVVRNMGTHIEVKSSGIPNDERGIGSVYVVPGMSNVVYLKPGEYL